MSKTILVLTGSPRQGGNCDILAEAFIQGAQSVGHKILRFDAGRKKVAGCVACETCFSTGNPCSFADDFSEYASYLQQADMIAIFTPLYWYGLPTQLKAAIDRMYCFYYTSTPTKVKESFFVICGGAPDTSVFDAAVMNYEKIAETIGWENKGQIVIPGAHAAGDVIKTPALEGMVKIGRAI